MLSSHKRIGQRTEKPPADMMPFPGSNGGNHRGDELDYIKKNDGDDVCDVVIRERRAIENNRERPVKPRGVHRQCHDLCQERLHTMPPDEAGRPPVREEIDS